MSPTDLARALDNPPAAFPRPSDVLLRGDLSRDEKIRILKRWEYDARLVEVAQEENMSGARPSALSEILDSLHRLGVSGSSSSPTKGGGT